MSANSIRIAVAAAFALAMAACSPAPGPGDASDASVDAVDANAGDGAVIGDTASACPYASATSATAIVAPSGCAVRTRDTSACDAARRAAGLTGYWLKFSCRVTLSRMASGGEMVVQAIADGIPDYSSNYFNAGDPCVETYAAGITNPNRIAPQSYTVFFRETPDMTPATMQGVAVVGLALNGVAVFGNFAAPGDDIFTEAMTFDRCGAHPERMGAYHYHSEPFSISYDDSNFIGVMRDGYPIYGRKDPDGSRPTLDSYGGHTGVTVDSPATAVYHYHLNEQTSTDPRTRGQRQWFLTTGNFRGSRGGCTGCGDR